ncbi:hypothetical protein BDV12DRAFT_201475 [Aspergillus spectabilis]
MEWSLILILQCLRFTTERPRQDCHKQHDLALHVGGLTRDPTYQRIGYSLLDAFARCTTITGHILLESGYAGDFVLNGVTAFIGNISTSESDPAEIMGAVEPPDLVNLGSLVLHRVADVHLPKLEHAVNLLLVQSSSGELDLGALVDANNIRVQGSWTHHNPYLHAMSVSASSRSRKSTKNWDSVP